MLAAITSTVKAITNISDIVIKFENFYRYSNVTEIKCSTVLRESIPGRSLKLLNAGTDEKFSSIMSKKLGVPVTMSGSLWYKASVYKYNSRYSNRNDRSNDWIGCKKMMF